MAKVAHRILASWTIFSLAICEPAQVWAKTVAMRRARSSVETPTEATRGPKGQPPTRERLRSTALRRQKTSQGRSPDWGAPSIVVDRVDLATGRIEGHALTSDLVAVRGPDGEAATIHLDGRFSLQVQSQAQDVEITALFADGQQSSATAPFEPCGVPAMNWLEPDKDAPHSKCIRAVDGGIIEYQGLRLQVPPGALPSDTRITIHPLGAGDVASLRAGHANVTSGAEAFRLGPPGLKFSQPVLLTLPMEAAELPVGLKLDDVYPVYYDTNQKKWTEIEKVGALDKRRLVGATTHFTDFMAATMPRPQTPGKKSFDPPELLKLKGDAMAGIPMVAEPTVDASGNAQLSHPIDLPPGRRGMTPQLAFQYSSGRGNGWLGVGWDIPMSRIEIDTRFGVPRYDGSEEGSYLLDGAALVPADAEIFAQRPWLKKVRNEGKVFVRRNGPPSETILRLGERAPYRWEVRGKDGRIRKYGSDANARMADPNETGFDKDRRQRVFRWYISEELDTYQNQIKYRYTHEEGCLDDVRKRKTETCDENYTAVYPERIEYNRNAQSAWQAYSSYYVVEFQMSKEVRRDTFLNARPGFIEVIRHRLQGVLVTAYVPSNFLDSSATDGNTRGFDPKKIRRYRLRYRSGDYGKLLVSSIALQGESDIDEDDKLSNDRYLVKHGFRYASLKKKKKSGKTERYPVFGQPESRSDLVWNDVERKFGLHRQKSTSSGASATAGFSLFGFLSASVSAGGNWGTSRTEQCLIDLHGDGLPDLIDDNQLFYRNKLKVSEPERSDDFKKRDIDGPRTGEFLRTSSARISDGALGQTRRKGVSVSGGVSLGIKKVGLGANLGYSRTWNNERKVMADMNGDGRVDLVRVAGSRVKVQLGTGDGGFSNQSINWGAFSKNEVPDDADKSADIEKERPRHLVDPLVRFFAPYSGRVRIQAPLRKVREGGDGAFAAIYRRNQGNLEQLWAREVRANDTETCVPAGEDGCDEDGIELELEAGDELWFRVSAASAPGKEIKGKTARLDGMDWRPVVDYVDLEAQLEPYGAQTQRFSLREDARVASHAAANWIASTQGRVRIEGLLEKDQTADDVELRVRVLDPQGGLLRTLRKTMLADASGAIDPGFEALEVQRGEQLVFEIDSDVAIDPARVRWLPNIVYDQYSRFDAQGESLVRGDVLCSEDGCYLAEDTRLDPIPYAAVSRPAIAAVFTKHYAPYDPRVAIGPARVVAADIKIRDLDAQGRAQTVLVLQSKHRLLAKARPNEDGRLVLQYALPDTLDPSEPMFLSLVGPKEIENAQVQGLTTTLNVRVLDPAYHSIDAWLDPSSGGHHRWRFGDFNGALDILRTPPRMPKTDPFEGDAPYFMAQSVRFSDSANKLSERWSMRAGAQIEGTVFRPAIAGDFSEQEDDPDGQGGIGEIRRGVSWNFDYGVSANAAGLEAGLRRNVGRSFPVLDLIDINGDGLPDSVRSDGVRYNYGLGRGFGPVEPLNLGFKNDPDFISLVRNYNATPALGRADDQRTMSVTDVRGKTLRLVSSHVAGGGSGGGSLSKSVSYGVSNGVIQMMDINGDGLVDQVRRDGHKHLQVRYGLGYRFSRPISWRAGRWKLKSVEGAPGFNAVMKVANAIAGSSSFEMLRKSDISVLNVNAGVGAPLSRVSVDVGVGAGVSYTMTRDFIDTVDINGDGLPDSVMKLPQENILRVRLNLGARFGEEQRWPIPDWPAKSLVADRFTTVGSPDVLGFSRDMSFNTSVSSTVSFPFFKVGGNGFHSRGVSSASLRLQDINGDGLVDHVLKSRFDETVYVKTNHLGKSNLLTSVRRPFGSRIDLEYRRAGNEIDKDAGIDMARTRFVLAGVRTKEASGDKYTKQYRFEGGNYDREERSFFGFSKATMTRVADGSRVENSFWNQDFFRNGQVKETRSFGAKAKANDEPFLIETRDCEAPRNVKARTSVFFPSWCEEQKVKLERGDSNVGLDSGRLTTRSRTQFDRRGDVYKSIEYGDTSDRSDDLEFRVAYHRPSAQPWVSLPKEIKVTKPQGRELLRHHRVEYDEKQSQIEFSEWVKGGNDQNESTQDAEYAGTRYEYDPYLGLLTSSTTPRGLTTQYKNQSNFKIQLSKVIYPGGLSYKRYYDPRFGSPTLTVDPNGQRVQSTYDDYGRLVTLDLPETYYRPHETGPKNNDEDPDLKVEYSTQGGRTSGYGPSQAWAKTMRRDVLSLRSDPIVSVQFKDSLGRVVQEKQDFLRYDIEQKSSKEGMIVSGQIRFDGLGRVDTVGQPTFQTLDEPSHLRGSDAEKLVEGAPKRPTRHLFDDQGRPAKTTFPDEREIKFGYGCSTLDGVLRFSKVTTDPLGRTKTSFARADGKLVGIKEQNRIGLSMRDLYTRYAYNRFGALTRVTDAKGFETTARYDERGLLVELASPDAGTTRWQYDLDGNLRRKETPVMVEAGFGGAIRYAYDNPYGFLSEITYEVSDPTKFEYGAPDKAGDKHGNLAGRVSRVTSQSGTSTFEYDALGRRTVETVTFEENTAPQWPSVRLEQRFDTLGRIGYVLHDDRNREGVFYRYDAGGNVLEVQSATPPYDIGFSRRGLIIGELGYDEFGRKVHERLGNGIVRQYSYDENNGRLTSALSRSYERNELGQIQGRGKLAHWVKYGYDAVGNVLSIEHADQVFDPHVKRFRSGLQLFGYDDLNQLTSASGSLFTRLGERRSYQYQSQYDELGNIVRRTQVSRAAKPGSFGFEQRVPQQSYDHIYRYQDKRPRVLKSVSLAEDAGPQSTPRYRFQYDASGSQRFKNGGERDFRSISWNDENQISFVIENGRTVSESLYDENNNRRLHTQRFPQEIGTVGYVSDQVTLVDGVSRTHHVMVNGQRVASRKVGTDFSDKQLTWAHADGRGTVEFESDSEGEVTSQVAYFPSGELWFAEASGTKHFPEFRFQGKEREATTGFYAFGKRHYEPRFGQWLSADPALPEYFTSSLSGGMTNPRNLGLYSYAWNNPVRFIDPDGRAVPVAVLVGLGALLLPALMGHDEPVDPEKSFTDGVLEGLLTFAPWGKMVPQSLRGSIGRLLSRAGGAKARAWFVNLVRGSDDALSSGGKSITPSAVVARMRKYWTSQTSFRGNKVFQRNDLIDPSRVGPKGATNLERMRAGKAPIGPDGKPVELHHMLQTMDGPLAEISQTLHRKASKTIHINPSSMPSGIDRGIFAKWRRAYWRVRAEDFR